MAIFQVEKKLETRFIINKQAKKLINKRRRKRKNEKRLHEEEKENIAFGLNPKPYLGLVWFYDLL
jgi:hypothetical protein